MTKSNKPKPIRVHTAKQKARAKEIRKKPTPRAEMNPEQLKRTTEAQRKSSEKYAKTEQGKATKAKYATSDKGKATRAAWEQKVAKKYSDGILSEIREAPGARMLLSEAAAEADQSNADSLILLSEGAVEEAGVDEENELFVDSENAHAIVHTMLLRDRGSLPQTEFYEPPLDSLVRSWSYRIGAKRDYECIVHATRFIDYVFGVGDGWVVRTNPHNGRDDRLLVWGGSDVDKCYKHMLGPTATERHLRMGCPQEDLHLLWLCALDPRGGRKETHGITRSADREVLEAFLVNSEDTASQAGGEGQGADLACEVQFRGA
jgi:hypothetical protein